MYQLVANETGIVVLKIDNDKSPALALVNACGDSNYHNTAFSVEKIDFFDQRIGHHEHYLNITKIGKNDILVTSSLDIREHDALHDQFYAQLKSDLKHG